MSPIYSRLALIGIGLIGSSIARAARAAGLVETIAISTRKAETLEEARGLGLGDVYTLDAREAVRDADLVILCTPVGAYAASAQVDFSYTSSHFFTVDNNPSLYEDGYWLVNANFTVRDAADRYSLSAWVKNLANEKYFVSGLANTALGFMELFPGLLRTFGMTLAARF